MNGKKKISIFNRMGRKNLALSIVAIVLATVLVVGTTYSWIENFSAIQITNVDVPEGQPKALLGITDDIYSTVKIGNCGASASNAKASKYAAIDIGSYLEDKRNNGQTMDVQHINKMPGEYFDSAGNAHLSACSGDGETFMFKTLKKSGGGTKLSYRVGTGDDENVGYISVTFVVESTDANVDFWFHEVPSAMNVATNTQIPVYYSFTIDGKTEVYTRSVSGSKDSDGYYKYDNIVSDDSNVAAEKANVRRASDYTFDHDNNPDNSNVLFSVDKGKRKVVTLNMWLQYTGNNQDMSDIDTRIDMILASTWAETRKITLYDGTTNTNNMNWIYDEGAKMYFALDEDPKNLHWEIDFDKATHEGHVTIPAYYYNKDVFILRVNKDYSWPDGQDMTGGYDGVITVRSSHNYPMYCWNYWKTTLPDSFGNQTFCFLGNTPIKKNASNKDEQSDTGYTAWDDVDEITVYDGDTELQHNNSQQQMLVRDEENGNCYVMYSDGSDKWKACVPRTSGKISFYYSSSTFWKNEWNSSTPGKTNNNYYMWQVNNNDGGGVLKWGYDTANKQIRPVNVTEYVLDSTTPNSNRECAGHWTDSYTSRTKCSLIGYFNGSDDWETGAKMYYESADSTKVYTTKNLEAGDHYFKVRLGSSDFYSENEATVGTDKQLRTNYNDNCKFTAPIDGTYLFVFDTSNGKINVNYAPSAPGSGEVRAYATITAGWEWNWLKLINHWPATNSKRTPIWIKDTTSHKVYYVDLETSANKMQFVKNGELNNGTDGYLAETSVTITNGAIYKLNNSASGITATTSGVQAVSSGTFKVNGSTSSVTVSLGTALTLEGIATTGNLPGNTRKHVSFYAKKPGSSSWFMIDSTYTPDATGTWQICARADDGYILSAATSAITVTVT